MRADIPQVFGKFTVNPQTRRNSERVWWRRHFHDPAGNQPPSSTPTSNVKLADSSNNYANVKTAYAATTYADQNVTNVYEFLLGER